MSKYCENPWTQSVVKLFDEPIRVVAEMVENNTLWT